MHKLYNELAWLWPLLSPPEDYEPEAEAIRTVIDAYFKHMPNQQPTLVEMGAGGGHTLSHLAGDFELLAVDISEPMLVNCSLICPEATTILGDMRTIDLQRMVDIVLIHDAVDYMLTAADVQAALHTAAKYLKPGGLLIVAPTYTTESFENNQSISDEHEDPQVRVAFTSRVSLVQDADNQFIMSMVFDITENGQTTRFTDEHRCGLFSENDWQQWITDAGLTYHHVDDLDDMPWHGFVGIR
jgi:trans-aconitate methyltransferase